MTEIKLENDVLKHIYNLLKTKQTLSIISPTIFAAVTDEGQVIFETIPDLSGQLTCVFITDTGNGLNVKKYYNNFRNSIEKVEGDMQLMPQLSIARHYYNDLSIEDVIAIDELKQAFSTINGFFHYKFLQMRYNSLYFDFNYMIGGYGIVIRLSIGEITYQVDPIIDGEIATDIRKKITNDCSNVLNHLNNIL